MNKFFTIKEMAEYLKLKPATVYRLAQKGVLPSFKAGGKWRFRRSSIDAWIEEREHKNDTGHNDKIKN